jgi:hypothetical protein
LKKSASKAIDPTRKITSTLYGSGPQYDSQKVPESYSFMDDYLCNSRCPTCLSVFKLVFTQLPLKIDASCWFIVGDQTAECAGRQKSACNPEAGDEIEAGADRHHKLEFNQPKFGLATPHGKQQI